MIVRQIIICLVACLFLSPPALYAGQYVRIEGADLSSSYPEGRIVLAIKGLPASLVTDPAEEALSVAEDGVKITRGITVRKQSDARNYLYMVFSIDTSKSISKKLLGSIKSAAREIVSSTGPNDEIAVYRFDDRVTRLNDFTRNTDRIIKNIDSVQRHGSKTLLYNSIYDSIELLNRVAQDNKKIIVFTDGKDEGSSVRDDDIIHLARAGGIPVYFICCRDSSRLKTMARIAKMTGGKVIYSERHSDIAGMYRTLLSIIKSRFVVHYPSSLKQDGKEHAVEVQLRHGDIIDRDSVVVTAALPDLWSRLKLDSSVLFWICLLLLVLIAAIIIYFINREKNIVIKNCEAEKKLLVENMLRAGEPPARQEDGPQGGHLPLEDVSRYARAWVYRKGSAGTEHKQELKVPVTVIGSDRESDIVIDDYAVSPRHAKIAFINGSYYLFDLISERGTVLNGKKLLRPKALYDWDEIMVGNSVLIFRGSIKTA